MERSKMSSIALLGVIIGATALGLGAFTMMQVQTGAVKGDNGDDGDDGSSGITTIVYRTDHEYPCSSQSEIEAALDTIGTGHGTIVITEDITLSSSIDINDGGNYIIRGEGLVTLDRNVDDEIFNIYNVQSLTLKNLIIDTSEITPNIAPGIYVKEKNNNSVYIQNVQISGSAGLGIRINSENVWVENCIITNVRYGIYLDYNSAYCHIIDNSVHEISYATNVVGIYLYKSNKNIISGNIVNDISSVDDEGYGIFLSDSNYNTISGNSVRNISTVSDTGYGISLDYSNYNTISDNSINSISSSLYSAYGIHLKNSDNNILTGNNIKSISVNGLNRALGIYIYTSDNNVLMGNNINSISASSGYANGIRLYYSYYNSLTGNNVNTISSIFDWAVGIYFTGSDNNTLLSNVIRDTQVSLIGYGIYGSNSDYNAIIGNSISLCVIGIDFPGATNEIDHNIGA